MYLSDSLIVKNWNVSSLTKRFHVNSCIIHLWLISIVGLGFGLGFLYYAGFFHWFDFDSVPLIEMYATGTEICPWDGDP